jgi:hypothetical protein
MLVMSRTRKQPYRKSRRFDKTCRCHGACPWCRDDRLHQARKAEAAAKYEMSLAESLGFTEASGAAPILSSAHRAHKLMLGKEE